MRVPFICPARKSPLILFVSSEARSGHRKTLLQSKEVDTFQLSRIDMIILNAICRFDHLYILEARYCTHHELLNFFREAAGETVGVNHICVESENEHASKTDN